MRKVHKAARKGVVPLRRIRRAVAKVAKQKRGKQVDACLKIGHNFFSWAGIFLLFYVFWFVFYQGYEPTVFYAE